MNEIDPRVERLVRECIGRIRGRFMYEEDEAIDVIQAVIAKTPRRKGKSGYIKSADMPANQPWKPGDPKPEHA